ncbi:hypothetical protein CAOG_01747 [Capsaspora owczarzaki ATCC 30864]|uniref:hypothetical protein n=1 Tax=Capsaspora owczarzaki (strain ATCC 30864) TaxID=595528 RepID=UPI0001FE36B0|nr:hypothetical protein CAOG_01747 [Capsaspora owczarzaki ATCC 30864]|eukprot:XP_004364615.1 hypothetical protein CAOG_01747 [Capsaspora owczarzaki ATCC 30864]
MLPLSQARRKSDFPATDPLTFGALVERILELPPVKPVINKYMSAQRHKPLESQKKPTYSFKGAQSAGESAAAESGKWDDDLTTVLESNSVEVQVRLTCSSSHHIVSYTRFTSGMTCRVCLVRARIKAERRKAQEASRRATSGSTNASSLPSHLQDMIPTLSSQASESTPGDLIIFTAQAAWKDFMEREQAKIDMPRHATTAQSFTKENKTGLLYTRKPDGPTPKALTLTDAQRTALNIQAGEPVFAASKKAYRCSNRQDQQQQRVAATRASGTAASAADSMSQSENAIAQHGNSRLPVHERVIDSIAHPHDYDQNFEAVPRLKLGCCRYSLTRYVLVHMHKKLEAWMIDRLDIRSWEEVLLEFVRHVSTAPRPKPSWEVRIESTRWFPSDAAVKTFLVRQLNGGASPDAVRLRELQKSCEQDPTTQGFEKAVQDLRPSRGQVMAAQAALVAEAAVPRAARQLFESLAPERAEISQRMRPSTRAASQSQQPRRYAGLDADEAGADDDDDEDAEENDGELDWGDGALASNARVAASVKRRAAPNRTAKWCKRPRTTRRKRSGRALNDDAHDETSDLDEAASQPSIFSQGETASTIADEDAS